MVENEEVGTVRRNGALRRWLIAAATIAAGLTLATGHAPAAKAEQNPGCHIVQTGGGLAL